MTTSDDARARQLAVWGLEIHKLAECIQAGQHRTRFEDLMRVDELKAWHAIAQARLDDFHGAIGSQRADLDAEIRDAWTELEAAFAPQEILNGTRPRP